MTGFLRNRRLLTSDNFLKRKEEKNRMIKTKKLHRVYGYGDLWDKKKIDFLYGIWCTNNFKCRNMSMKDAFKKQRMYKRTYYR